MGTIFVRFEKYLYMVCLKMAHLGRVTYCFETLLILCKLVFFNCNFHKNIRRQKRFVAKQGQPRPHIQLKATILDKTVEKMSHSQTIFPNILAVPRPPFPLPLEAMLLCVLKQP